MATKTLPAIYSGLLGWGWVQLEELCEILNLTPDQLFERYGALSKDLHYLTVEMGGRLHVLTFGILELVPIGPDQIREWAKETFVPAGWAKAVLNARANGYTRVVLENIYIEDEKDEPNYLNVTHNIGFHNNFWVAVGYKD